MHSSQADHLHGVAALTGAAFLYATIGILIVVTALLPSNAVTTIHPRSFLAAAIFAVVSVLLGILLLYGYRHCDVNIGTVIMATELGFVLLLGWIVYREVPTSNEIIGSTLIFAASLVSVAFAFNSHRIHDATVTVDITSGEAAPREPLT